MKTSISVPDELWQDALDHVGLKREYQHLISRSAMVQEALAFYIKNADPREFYSEDYFK